MSFMVAAGYVGGTVRSVFYARVAWLQVLGGGVPPRRFAVSVYCVHQRHPGKRNE